MNVNKINSTTFSGGIKVAAAQNKANRYMYNQVMDIVKRNHVSATISNEGFDFPSVTKKVISDLKELGIAFVQKK